MPRTLPTISSFLIVFLSTVSVQAADYPPGSVMWYVGHAKATNETRVQLPALKVLEAQIGDLSSVAQRSSLVIVDLLEQCTSHSTYDIETWTKYKIRERLGHYSVVGRNRTAPVADCLTPLGENEFVVSEPFGTVQIGGVEISRAAPLNADHLPKGEQRLMFVQFIGDGSLAYLPFGQKGQFSITADGHIRSHGSSLSNALADDIENSCHNLVSTLRAMVQALPQIGAAK